MGIPLAAFGLLSPAIAGAAMALSSVSVVGIALLLRRWRASERAPVWWFAWAESWRCYLKRIQAGVDTRTARACGGDAIPRYRT